MRILTVSTGDIDCRYLAAPGSADRSQFGSHLESLGIKLPPSLSIRTMVARGWLTPRLRVALPVAALSSWRNLPTYPADYDASCPAEDTWAWNAWCASACGWDDRNRLPEKLWMHWLDDPENATGVQARRHAIEPSPAAEPPSFVHPHRDRSVLPWIDFFADWQAYHVADLVRSAVCTMHGITDQFRSWDTHLRERARKFDQAAQDLAARWEKRGAFFDIVSGYRTILGHCATRDTFGRDVSAGARAFAVQRDLDAAAVRRGIRGVLLHLWQRWEGAPPIPSPRLLHRLQQDIQNACRLWSDLTGKPVDPFDPFWYSLSPDRGDAAQLLDALPHEEWLARRDFPRIAVHYQRDFPQLYVMGESLIADLLAKHWDACSPLRRFCLAWVRLDAQLQPHDTDRLADQTIAANERIEQFNLIGLHTERLLRHVHAETGKPEPDVKPIVRAAVQRSVRRTAKSHLNAAGKRFSELLDETKLHQQRSADDLTIPSSGVGTGSTAADQLVAAHLNALILRNYAAHHDYLDDDLINPSRDEARPYAGATLLSSCLLVVVAALVGLPRDDAQAP